MEIFLAYGVTTLHKYVIQMLHWSGSDHFNQLIISPSADNVDSFVERSRNESGLMVGPRIFSVGSIVYGAAFDGLHQEIVNMDEAVSALTRIKVEGGPGAISYKNYNLPSRFVRIMNLKNDYS
jgi:hypothetical protein